MSSIVFDIHVPNDVTQSVKIKYISETNVRLTMFYCELPEIMFQISSEHQWSEEKQ